MKRTDMNARSTKLFTILSCLLVLIILIKRTNCQADHINYGNVVKDLSWFIDRDRIVNVHPFRYLMSPGNRICSENQGSNIELLIYVHTAPKHFKHRTNQR